MPTRYYKVTKDAEGKVVVEARHPKAKQVLWGWGGGSRPGGMELYGYETGVFQGDWTDWTWKLSEDGVAELRRCLAMELATPSEFESGPFEQRRCRELLALLDKVAPK